VTAWSTLKQTNKKQNKTKQTTKNKKQKTAGRDRGPGWASSFRL